MSMFLLSQHIRAFPSSFGVSRVLGSAFGQDPRHDLGQFRFSFMNDVLPCPLHVHATCSFWRWPANPNPLSRSGPLRVQWRG
jgi:hypothetical protein